MAANPTDSIDPVINLAEMLPISSANGPGRRAVLWFQGCQRLCPGCCNPEMQAHVPRRRWRVSQVLAWLEAQAAQVQGLTVSGGEPLEQQQGLLHLLANVGQRFSLSVLLFSGYTLPGIERLALGREILRHVDVLIAGPYVARLRHGQGLRASLNQRIHLLTDRYSLAEVEATPVAEVLIGADGRVAVTGVQPVRIRTRADHRVATIACHLWGTRLT